ncbi:hypothetical protein [Polyangium sp. 15x6]|uniref:hypothetical protein n=1 Tax=Polyangium sp. 15x6 TaxID=3042687 RepID=UPI00249BC8A3|nr:hypothetical protein [Polyangium sp. 15x6]MDI3282290.1 hypothetical protein [Polyangium sp. 15x6]
MPSFFPFPGSGQTLPSAPAADIPAPRPARADSTLESVPPPADEAIDLAWDDTQPMSVVAFAQSAAKQ